MCDSDGPQRSFKLKAEMKAEMTSSEIKAETKAAPALASAERAGAWRACSGGGDPSGGPPAHTWSRALSKLSWRPGASTAGGTSKREGAAALKALKAERARASTSDSASPLNPRGAWANAASRVGSGASARETLTLTPTLTLTLTSTLALALTLTPTLTQP